MRIIAGKHRGRKLLPPEGDVTRPITDRVKQSLFDILAPDIEGAVVLDLFAGTGSMGLECLSRGAKYVTFFEADPSAAMRLGQNLKAMGIPQFSQEKAQASSNAVDVFRWFDRWEKSLHAGMHTSEHGMPADLVFLDPPYRFVRERAKDLQNLVRQLIELKAIHDQSIIVFRHDAADSLEIPPLQRYDKREYGGMTLEFLASKPTTAA